MTEENKTLLSKFISDKNSICREERQYALYLYNILYKYHIDKKSNAVIEKIFGEELKEGGELEIDEVFYEATFMRDLFEYNRRLHFLKKPKEKNEIYMGKKPDIDEYKNIEKRINFENGNKEDKYNKQAVSFNYRLFHYLSEGNKCGDEQKQEYKYGYTQENVDIAWDQLELLEKEYHLGQYTGFVDKNESKADGVYSIIEDMKSMMNAKPDIAVIYHKEGKKYLLFLECKFESGESKDRGRDQTNIQYMIADFLCSSYIEINGMQFGCEVSPLMRKKSKSLKVEFYRYDSEILNDNQDSDEDNNGDIKISIEYLINSNINEMNMSVGNKICNEEIVND